MSPHSIKGVTMVELKQDGIKETTMQATLKDTRETHIHRSTAVLSQHWNQFHGTQQKIICQVKLQQFGENSN